MPLVPDLDEDFANEPGPGYYFGPNSPNYNSIGPQRLGKCQSAPEISLARTGWDNWSKVCITKVHAKAYQGRDSPGANYDIRGGLETKGARMGTSTRPPLSVVDPYASPGPVYNVAETILNVPKVRCKKGFGGSTRFRDGPGCGGCGPGEYPRKDSALNSGSGRSIGAGRVAWQKVITPGWEVEGRCQASPGPGEPLWSDIKQEGSRACGFGRAERFRTLKSQMGPGPGYYKRNERDVGRTSQPLSDTRNPPGVRLGKRCKDAREPASSGSR